MHHFNPRTTRTTIRPARALGPLLVSGDYVISATTDPQAPYLLSRGETALARRSDLEALKGTAACIADDDAMVWTAVTQARSA